MRLTVVCDRCGGSGWEDAGSALAHQSDLPKHRPEASAQDITDAIDFAYRGLEWIANRKDLPARLTDWACEVYERWPNVFAWELELIADGCRNDFVKLDRRLATVGK